MTIVESLGLARGGTKLNCNTLWVKWTGCKTVKGIYTTKKSAKWLQYQSLWLQLQCKCKLSQHLTIREGVRYCYGRVGGA